MTVDPDLTSLQAILFDLDGTLVETDNRWAQVLAAKLQPVTRVLPGADVDALSRQLVMALETPTNYVMSILEHLGLGSSFFGLADRVRRSKGLATRRGSRLIEGTGALLEALAGRYKLAVVTTRARPEAEAFVRQIGGACHFSAVITREDVWGIKPNPAPVLKAAARLGVAAERCALVGDTTMDVVAARRAGAVAIGVLSGFAHRRELERAGAQLVLGRAEEILAHLPPIARPPPGQDSLDPERKG